MEELKSGYTTELEVLEREGSRWVLDGDEDRYHDERHPMRMKRFKKGIWYKFSCIPTDVVN